MNVAGDVCERKEERQDGRSIAASWRNLPTDGSFLTWTLATTETICANNTVCSTEYGKAIAMDSRTCYLHCACFTTTPWLLAPSSQSHLSSKSAQPPH